MNTIPALDGLLRPGAPVVITRGAFTGFEGFVTEIRPGAVHCVGQLNEGRESDVAIVNGHYNGHCYPADLAIVLDDPDRLGQTLALGWLARALGVLEPAVGCAPWVRVATYWMVAFEFGGFIFVFGAATPLPWADGTTEDRIIRCPALGNPDAADAPIRALGLAIVTVQRKEWA